MAARVVLGFSGGVDSLAAALILQERGYEVIPVFLEMGGSGAGFLRDRTRQAAAGLGLQLRVEEVSERFAARVVDYLKAAYLRAETPNPCLRCNAAVKFAGLAEVGDRLGIRALATGHYCRARPEITDGPAASERCYLKARDRAKDQSYFLFLVPEKILRRVVFPLGDLPKAEVLKIAVAAGYELEDYRESQELCFLNGENYRDFLRREGVAGTGPGEIVDLRGEVLGRHDGLENYTVGQRRGLDIAWSEPLYVVRLEPSRNRLVVGCRVAAGGRFFTVADLNWLTRPPAGELAVSCQIRYRHRPAPALLRFRPASGSVRVEFAEPQFAVTPGQGAAFYDGERLLGGGIIDAVEPAGFQDAAEGGE